jgi:hypothetical protein
MLKSASLVCALALAATAADAADGSYLDLRVGAGLLSTQFKGASSTTVTDSSTGITTTSSGGDSGRNASSNGRVQAQVVGGSLGEFGGLVGGVGVAVNRARFGDGDFHSTVTTPIVDVEVGYGIAPLSWWNFEVMPFAGYGRAQYRFDDPIGRATGSSNYWEYGIKAGTYISILNTFQVGVEVPYLVGRYDVDFSHDGGSGRSSVSDRRRNEGFGVLLTLGLRL